MNLKNSKVGIIRVITTDNQNILYAHEKRLKEYFPNLIIETKCIPNQYRGIYNTETKQKAIPEIVKLAEYFEKNGANIIFISCAEDPGVKECRELLNIPIIGAGSACAALALAIGNKIGTLGIIPNIPDVMKHILRETFVANIKPEEVSCTLDLMSYKGKNNTLKAVEQLIEMGCDTVALACTGMSTIGLSEIISKSFNIKVVDPVLAAGAIINYLNNIIDN